MSKQLAVATTRFNPIKPITYVTFSPLSGEHIQRYGIRLTKPYSHNTPSTEDTPADERLGDKNKCKTCSMDYNECPGHFGYIPLARPVYNLSYISYIVNILKCFCIECSSLLAPDFTTKSEGNAKLTAYRDRIDKVKECGKCGAARQKISYDKKMYIFYGDVEFPADEALRVFERISNEDLEKIGLNTALPKTVDVSTISMPSRYSHPLQVRPEAFIFTHLPVIPIQARPHIMQNGERKEDTLTEHYNSIIKNNNYLALKLNRLDIVDPSFVEKKRGGKSKKTEHELYETLQHNIHMLISNKKVKGGTGKSDHKFNGLDERVSGKHGHIQSNAGGKRSDHNARDVIVSAGPCQAMDEIGIPEWFAKTLSVPDVITSWNLEYYNRRLHEASYCCRVCSRKFNSRELAVDHFKLSECQKRFPTFEGCIETVPSGFVCSINRGRGIQDLKRLTANYTKPLEMDGIVGFRVGDKIERHLQDGDLVYINRQPTISLESIQGFRVKILRNGQLAFCLPLPSTRAFNADFDGVCRFQ
jgi:DNA-directed RNA polymerase beta' subunit